MERKRTLRALFVGIINIFNNIDIILAPTPQYLVSYCLNCWVMSDIPIGF